MAYVNELIPFQKSGRINVTYISTYTAQSSMLKDVGMAQLVNTFRFYGLNLEASSDGSKHKQLRNLNKIVPIFLLEAYFHIYIVICIAEMFTGVSPKAAANNEYRFMLTSQLIVTIEVIIMYINTCVSFQTHKDVLLALAKMINQICNGNKYHPLIRGIRRRVSMLIIATVIVSATSALPTLTKILRKILFGLNVETEDAPVIHFKIAAVLYIPMVVFNRGFMYFYILFVVFVSNLLCNCFTHHLDRPNRISIAEYQQNHQNLSNIVKKANDLFSIYTFTFLSMETVLLIHNTKSLFLTYDESETIFAMSEAIIDQFRRIFLLVVTIWYCSKINLKVFTTLALPQHILASNRTIEQDITENMNYLLYFEDAILNRVCIKYFGFLLLKKRVIFNILKVVLTYTLVAKDIVNKRS